MHHFIDRMAHTTAFVTPVVEHWLEREIAQWVHHEGSIRRCALVCVCVVSDCHHGLIYSTDLWLVLVLIGQNDDDIIEMVSHFKHQYTNGRRS